MAGIITTEALLLMLDYAFANFDLVRLQGGVFENKPASTHMLEKDNFVKKPSVKKLLLKKAECWMSTYMR